MHLFTRLRSANFAHILDFGLVLGGAAFATGTGFLLKVLIGRNLGPDQLGIFGICYAFLTIVSMLADLGVRYSLVNLASKAFNDENRERARRLVVAGLVLKMLGGLLVACIMVRVLGVGAIYMVACWLLVASLQVTVVVLVALIVTRSTRPKASNSTRRAGIGVSAAVCQWET